MVVDTIKEKLCVNKLIATKKEILLIEGDMIVPDSKPDILNTICTSGVECIYKKEVQNDRVRIDGNINTYIMYLSEDSQDKIRGINTSLDFSENIQVPNAQEGMNCVCKTKLKDIEAKVINGRKVGIKATLEVDIKVYSNEEVEIINQLENTEGIQMLKEDLQVNSLVGTGENKVFAKDTINIDNIDNLVEILKVNTCICNKDIKISYNKILTKADLEIKIMYLTEDNRINHINTKIPIVGFIDIQNVVDGNTCDANYEIKNLIIKPNSIEEHSIYIEAEIGVNAAVYEEKQINFIQDLYSPIDNLEFNKKKVTTMSRRKNNQEIKQIREKVKLEGIDGKNIIDVDIIPNIQKENILNNKIVYEGELQLKFVVANSNLDIDMKNAKLPFEYILETDENSDNISTDTNIDIINKDFIIQDGGDVNINIDMSVNINSYKISSLNIMDEIQKNGEKEQNDYSLVMYIVKKGDTLWNIAKKFNSTVDEIVKINDIKNENIITPGEKLYIPKYYKVEVNSDVDPMINYG